ncbi:MAG: hypothetical protein Q4G34_07820 [Micrococcus sp.]|nr:hypothetical protein [Micrococcus sp.]
MGADKLFTPEPALWSGTCAFRLMPDHELNPLPSTAATTMVAEGVAWTLAYVWLHPDDGVQEGHLLVGGPAEDGSVSAAWVDSWHQKDEIASLHGTNRCPDAGDGVITLEMEYSGWGWRIEVERAEQVLRMRMDNVIPAGVEGAEPGPYRVMDATWEPSRR